MIYDTDVRSRGPLGGLGWRVKAGEGVNLGGAREYFKCGISRRALSHLTLEETLLLAHLVGREFDLGLSSSVIWIFFSFTRSAKRGGGHEEATRSTVTWQCL